MPPVIEFQHFNPTSSYELCTRDSYTRSFPNSAYSHLIKTLNNNLSFVPFMLRSSQKALYLLAPFIAYSYTYSHTLWIQHHTANKTLYIARWTKTIEPKHKRQPRRNEPAHILVWYFKIVRLCAKIQSACEGRRRRRQRQTQRKYTKNNVKEM